MRNAITCNAIIWSMLRHCANGIKTDFFYAKQSIASHFYFLNHFLNIDFVLDLDLDLDF
jgi:hypothetical protein